MEEQVGFGCLAGWGDPQQRTLDAGRQPGLPSSRPVSVTDDTKRHAVEPSSTRLTLRYPRPATPGNREDLGGGIFGIGDAQATNAIPEDRLVMSLEQVLE
jgi:hypothetical protein